MALRPRSAADMLLLPLAPGFGAMACLLVAGSGITGGQDHILMLAGCLLLLCSAALFAIFRWKLQALEKKLHKLEEENLQVKQLSKAKSDFIANVSHELRTPLNAVLGYSEVIRAETFGKINNKKYTEYAGDIHNSGLHLLELVNDLLDIAKIEAGKLDVSLSVFDVQEEIRFSVDLLSRQADERDITVLQDTVPCFLTSDRLRLRQVLINLLSNAIKYNRKSGSVEIRTRPAPQGLLVQVRDSGDGMTDGEIHEASARYGRLVDAVDRGIEGTGLGLPLSIAIIERLGTDFSISSQQGEGTTISFSLRDLGEEGSFAASGEAEDRPDGQAAPIAASAG